ncbi:hypothetical protein [Methyloversatilis sp.]|uniref:hypothetical protein n=1 Tax=Methyloversatilis sp. TaxID=2569862 RepID=UPI0035AFC41D
MNGKRYQVRSRSEHNCWLHEVFDSTTGEAVLAPNTDLAWCFDGAALLESGLGIDETLELLSVRPVVRQCGC